MAILARHRPNDMNKLRRYIKGLLASDNENDYYYDSNGNRHPKKYGRGGFTVQGVGFYFVVLLVLGAIAWILSLLGVPVFTK